MAIGILYNSVIIVLIIIIIVLPVVVSFHRRERLVTRRAGHGVISSSDPRALLLRNFTLSEKETW